MANIEELAKQLANPAPTFEDPEDDERDGKSPARRYDQPGKFREEKRWFSSNYIRPTDVPINSRLESDSMAPFKDLIWNFPTKEILHGYGSTPEELAHLCGQGPDGWLCSSLITWMLDRLNEVQSTALCTCLSAYSPQELLRLTQRRNVQQVERLIFVANVGKNDDDSVYFATPTRSGSHWVMITVDLTDHPLVNYCDSYGWDAPSDLKNVLATYTQLFGLPQLQEISVQLMHAPTPLGHKHTCTAGCRNFPLQTCTSVCGVVVVVCSAIAALDDRLFGLLTGPRSGTRLYLHEPTRYEKYLRRVLISWLVANSVDMAPVWLWGQPSQRDSQVQEDLSSSAAASDCKRKAADASSSTPSLSFPPSSQSAKAEAHSLATDTASNTIPPSQSANTKADTSSTASSITARSLLANIKPCTSATVSITTPHSLLANTETHTSATPSSTNPHSLLANIKPCPSATTSNTNPRSLLANTETHASATPSSTNPRSLLANVKPCPSATASSTTSRSLLANTETHTSTTPSSTNPCSLLANVKPYPSATASNTNPRSLLANTETHSSATPSSTNPRSLLANIKPRPSATTSNTASPSLLAIIKPHTSSNTTPPPLLAIIRPRISATASNTPARSLLANIKPRIAATASSTTPLSLLANTTPLPQSANTKPHISAMASHTTPPSQSANTKARTSATAPNTNRLPRSTKTNGGSAPCSSLSGKKSQKEHFCPFCCSKFTTRQALYKHKRRMHRVERVYRNNSETGNCVCQLCHDFKVICIQDLIAHYQIKHEQPLRISKRTFDNEQDFDLWRKQMEKDSASQFVQPCGAKAFAEHTKTYYYCHRSGKERHDTSDTTCEKKRRKPRGSVKLGFTCTAFITACKNSLSGTVAVEYCLQHIGHSLELAHLNISHDLRAFIVGKLAQGVEITTILDEIRQKMTDVTPDTLVTRKDVQNIKQQYNISGTQKHHEDDASVHLWVDELKSDTENPVIFYKAEGTQYDHLRKEDFLLCIQTSFQRNMLVKCSSDMILIDSTHIATQHDFLLTTVLVVDELEEAVPVAWAISSREDAEILQVFFKSLKYSCGQDLTTNIFMSDLSDNFFKAWCATFPQPVRRLYCSWHVDKCWRKLIRESIVGDEDQCNTYAYLKLLESDTNEANFGKTLQQFLALLEKTSPKFLASFQQDFVKDNKIFLWAACFRPGTAANTNMYAEAFQQTLEHICFSEKQNRMDYLLVVMLKIARDKAVEQLMKLKKGKLTRHLREIEKRHEDAENVTHIERKVDAEAEWSVPSSAVDGRVYSVTRVGNEACSCKLVCDKCQVCIHMYTCTCPDFLTKAVTCVHIHAVHKLSADDNLGQLMDREDTDDGDHADCSETLLCAEEPDNSDHIKKLKLDIFRKTNEISQLVNATTNVCVLQILCQGLQDACSSLKECPAGSPEKKRKRDSKSKLKKHKQKKHK